MAQDKKYFNCEACKGEGEVYDLCWKANIDCRECEGTGRKLSPMIEIEVWYVKPEHGRSARLGELTPNLGDVSATHVRVGKHYAEPGEAIGHGLEAAYHAFQAEHWSPNGEMRDMIRDLGLQHTSMSAGDLLVVAGYAVYRVAGIGFDLLGHVPQPGEQELVLKVLQIVTSAILDATKEAGPLGIPSGPLYNVLAQQGLTLPVYNEVIRVLVQEKKVEVRQHCLHHVGG